MEVIKITAKKLNAAGYCGPLGGWITGTHYALFQDGKGFVSLDNKHVYILKGNVGREALQGIIDAGGFVGPVYYKQNI